MNEAESLRNGFLSELKVCLQHLNEKSNSDHSLPDGFYTNNVGNIAILSAASQTAVIEAYNEIRDWNNKLQKHWREKIVYGPANQVPETLTSAVVGAMEALKQDPIVETDSSRDVFVAMWFDDSMDEAWRNGFKAAIEETGYEPVRVDERHHNNFIEAEIIDCIRNAKFLVADFTSSTYEDPNGNRISCPRGGVYYEAGFAHGLGKDVIFSCHIDQFDGVHFDTSHRNHILWRTPAELRTTLRERIVETIGICPVREE